MCGIIGIWAKNNNGKAQIPLLEKALTTIEHRGPDHSACKLYSNCGFGHARLSVIDTDSRSNQPFCSPDERYTLVFNGEIYNFRELRAELEEEGVVFKTESDTEVLFHLLINKGVEALDKLNGFFAFAFYDKAEETVLLARDRMGIKPLLIYEDRDKFVFASELHAFKAFETDWLLDDSALNDYFSLTYIPASKSILKKASKVEPGGYAIINNEGISFEKYYRLKEGKACLTHNEIKVNLRSVLEKSVASRMVSDVPLGCFLSGGLDSSIIAALAIKNNPKLKTFSIGFDHAYFNETSYANEVAKFIGSQHFVYKLTKADFKKNFTDFLNTIDEPFADSSAFAVYLLSLKVKEEVTVALSGDGADELFGGYRKHFAEFQTRNIGATKKAGVKLAAKVLKPFKSNRSDKFGELNRKISKFDKGLRLSPVERYWKWCQFIGEEDRKRLLSRQFQENQYPYDFPKSGEWEDLNSIFLADQTLVLPNDMLKKVDLMSMASALEVRTPFLDHNVVEFANFLPASYKVNSNGGKMILKETFADLLPESVLNRSKKGFEIPIKEWLGGEIEAIFTGSLFSKEYIESQGLFNHDFLMELRKDWGSAHFGDRIYLVWALIVFQHWWDRVLKNG